MGAFLIVETSQQAFVLPFGSVQTAKETMENGAKKISELNFLCSNNKPAVFNHADVLSMYVCKIVQKVKK